MRSALVVVAHPDDETIWMGGMILRKSKWKWAIICLCRKNDAERSKKLEDACRILNARCFISDLDDEHPERPLDSLASIKRRIMQFAGDGEFDFIFTHGSNGEYGHNRHKEAHRAVKALLKQKKLRCKKFFSFCYKRDRKISRCIPAKGANYALKLSKSELKKKKYLINNIYCFSKGSFESLSCSGKESFRADDAN